MGGDEFLDNDKHTCLSAYSVKRHYIAHWLIPKDKYSKFLSLRNK